MRLPGSVAGKTTTLTVAGLLGSVSMAVASYGAGATFTARTDETRFAEQLTELSYAAGLVAWLIGGGLLAVAWWRLGGVIRTGGIDHRRLIRIAVAWAVPLLFSMPAGSRDVYAYALQGLLYVNGLDPYAVGPAALASPWLPTMSAFWQHAPTPYGPLAVLLSGAAAALSGGHLVVALVVLRVTALIGVVLTAVHLPRLARTCGIDPAVASWLAVASPLVLVHLISGAHHDALTLGLLVAGLDLAARRRGWQSGLALGLAAAVKVTAVIVIPFAVLLVAAAFSGRRRLIPATASVVLPALAVFAALSVAGGLGLGWVRGAPGPHSVVHWMSVPSAAGLVLGGLADLSGVPLARSAVVAAVRISAFYVVLPVVLTRLWWRVRHSTDPRRVTMAAGCALAAAVLLSPLVYPWYFVAPIAILAAATDRHRTRVAIAVIVLFGVFVILPDGINLAHLTKWPGAVAVVVALIGLAVRRLQAARATAPNSAGARSASTTP